MAAGGGTSGYGPNVKRTYQFLLSKGLSPAQAAGAVGGLMGESGPDLSTTARNPTSGAYGIGQWLGGRKSALLSQKNPSSLTTQLNHLWSELQGSERGAYSQLKSAKTIDQAVDAWVRGFERPSASEISSSIGGRRSSAHNVFNALKGTNALVDAASGAPGATDGSTPTAGAPGVPQGSTGLLGALQQMLDTKPPPPPVTAPAPPAFTAGPPTPAGYQPPASSGGPQPKQSAADLLQAIQTQGGDIQQPQDAGAPSGASATGTVSGDAGGAAGYPLGEPGKIIGTPYKGTHTLGNWQSDNAVDIAVPVGTPMAALQDGVVVKVRHHPQDGGRFAGDQITVRGKDGNEFFYAHGVAAVKPGQKIRAGQVLGRSGSANGVAHLHFGVEKGDPRKLLGQR